MNTPNIFKYATSELSQDAFILWLLQWSNPEFETADKALCVTSQNFVRLLLHKEDLKITSVECKKQENHIDVFAVVNGKYALIVEDKTNTSEHGNQIQRYYDWVKQEKKYSNLEIHCVYYKTGNESAYKLKSLAQKYETDFPTEHFTVVTRKEIIEVLSPSTSTNAVFTDYLAYIQSIQDRTEAYKILPIRKWDYLCWQGFYMNLYSLLETGDWGYVANPSGGFFGFWWHWRSLTSHPGIDLYLQFEQGLLCIKAYGKDGGKSGIRLSDWIIQIAKEKGLSITKPTKRRCGKTMTLAWVEWHNSEMLEVSKVVEQLKKAEQFINEVCSLSIGR